MKLKYIFTFWFIISVHKSLVELTTMCEGVAYPVVAFHDKVLFEKYLKLFANVPTVAQCASLCVRNMYCASFFHSKKDRKCHLHYEVLQDPSHAYKHSGNRYYILSAEDITPRRSPTSLKMICSWISKFIYGSSSTAELCFAYLFGSYNVSLASSYCAVYGSRLLQLETSWKTDLIKHHLNNFPESQSAYIGATYSGEGWVWNWDVTNPIHFFDWSSTAESIEDDENGACVVLSQATGNTWVNVHCSWKTNFVCEIVF